MIHDKWHSIILTRKKGMHKVSDWMICGMVNSDLYQILRTKFRIIVIEGNAWSESDLNSLQTATNWRSAVPDKDWESIPRIQIRRQEGSVTKVE